MTSQLALFGGTPEVTPDLHRAWPIIGEEERAAVMRVLDRGVLSGAFAPEAMAFQEEFAEYMGAKHALMANSGTSALVLALGAAGIRPGDEVIVPAYTFVATPLSPALLGAIPIFCDVKADTGNLDPAGLEALITPRTKAIMPVHVHGCPADMDEILAIANKHNLVVIEDAAQAHGATYKGAPVGALGVGGGFSLQSSKNLSAGEGGVYVTNSAEMADLANSFRNFGQVAPLSGAANYDPKRPLDGRGPYNSTRVGSMYRGNEMAAAFARAQLRRLPELTAAAQANGSYLSERLAALPGVTPPVVPSDRTTVYHKFRVILDAEAAGLDPSALGPTTLRDAMLEALRAEGVEAVMWERVPQPDLTVFQEHDGYPWTERDAHAAQNYQADYPVARKLLQTSLVLFCHSAPLIAQERATVERYADAFEKVWNQRQAVVQRAL